MAMVEEVVGMVEASVVAASISVVVASISVVVAAISVVAEVISLGIVLPAIASQNTEGASETRLLSRSDRWLDWPTNRKSD